MSRTIPGSGSETGGSSPERTIMGVETAGRPGKGRARAYSKVRWTVLVCMLLVIAGGVPPAFANQSTSVSSGGSSVSAGGGPNRAPVARDDSFVTNEDRKLTVRARGVLKNDRDSRGDRISARQVSGVKHGRLALRRDGSFDYTPGKNYKGVDSFTYVAVDGKGKTDRATVRITVRSVNDAPIARDDVHRTGEDRKLTVRAPGVLKNDADVDRDRLFATKISGPARGRLTLRSDGSFDYTPNRDFSARDSFTYRVSDGKGGSDTATVAVYADAINDAPRFAKGPDQSVDEDAGAQSIRGWATGISAGPTDESGQGLKFEVTGNTNPALFAEAPAIAPNGTLTYRSAENASGSASVTVRLKDNGGIARGGVDTSPAQAFQITAAPINDAPTVTTDSGISAYTEGDPGVEVSPGLTVGDPDSANLAGATVAITEGYESGTDTLSFVDQNGITGSYDATTGVLTLSGGASASDYQTALRSVRYGNTSNTPRTGTRTVSFRADDGEAANNLSGTATRGVSITEVNSAPVITTSVGATSFTENDPAVTIDNALTVSDNDSTTIVGATVSITGGLAKGQDVLSFVDQNGITGTYNGDAGILTLTGSASLADYQAALRSVRYGNTSSTPDTGTRTVSFRADDGSTVSNLSNTATKNVSVTSVNDPPTVTVSSGATSFTENDPAVAVDGGLTVADADSTGLVGATVSITANFANGQDELLFTDQNGISGSYDASTGTLMLSGVATNAQYQAALRSITYRNGSENPGGATRTVSFVVDDGSASSNPSNAAKSVTVAPVNDAPGLTVPASILADEDVATVLTGISASDADAGSGSVVMTLSVPSGTLSASSGGGVTIGGTPGARTLTGSVADINAFIAASSVEFTTARDASDDVTLTTTIDDGGNTGPDGAKTDTKTTTIDVQPINDAPVADDESFSGTSRAVGNTSFVVNDTDDGAPDPSGPQKTITGDILDGDNDADGPGPLAVQAGTFDTNDGGTVEIQADGDFTLLPKAGTSCTDHSDFFDYTLTDQNSTANPGTPATDTGRVTVEIQDCVWYVDGSAASNGTGRSDSPFNTLNVSGGSGINGAGGTGDSDDTDQKIFLYDGTYSGGLPLENGQRLLSERHGLSVSDGAAGSVELVPGDPAGPNSTITDGLRLGSNNTVQGIHLGNASGAALSGSSVGTATMNTRTSGAIANATGQAVSVSTGALDMQFTGVSSTGSPGNGIELRGTSGTFDATGGSLRNATQAGVLLVGGDTNFAYGGTVDDDTGQLVSVSDQTGGTKDFNGAITDGNDGDGNGISLSNNAGATVRFDGGLTLSTGGNAAFAATGGGNVVVTDPAGPADNTIATTTGIALNVANTTIGPDDLVFRNISANGAPNGIVLNTTGTSGGLTVTGTGTTAGSGGTIRNTTGADSTNAGIGISLNETSAPSLSNMQINDHSNFAIRGNNVAGFTLSNSVINGTNGNNANIDEASVAFDGLTGSAGITDTNISGGHEDNFRVLNGSGTLDRIVFDNVNVGANSTAEGNDGVMLIPSNNAVMKATVRNSDFTSARGDLFQMDAKNTATADLVFADNTLTNNHPNIVTGGGGVSVFIGGENTANPTMTYSITGNTLRDARGHGLLVSNAGGVGTMRGTVSGNQIGVAATANSGSREGSGLAVLTLGGGTHTAAVTNNQIRQYNNQGILLQTGESDRGGQGALNATVTGNTISNPGNLGTLAMNGIHLNSGTIAADAYQNCIQIGGAASLANSLTGSGSLGGTDFRLRQRQQTTVRLPGYAGGNNNNAAVVSFVQGNNGGTPSGSAANSVPTGGGFVGGASCPQP